MKQEEDLINKYGKDSGMRVPEGYFAEVEKQILQKLPPYQKKKHEVVLSRWQRVKPYVYLAAMFCGIWLMMKVFHTVTQPMTLSLENPPEALVELIDNNSELDLLYLHSNYADEWDDDDFYQSYDNIEEFEADFNAL